MVWGLSFCPYVVCEVSFGARGKKHLMHRMWPMVLLVPTFHISSPPGGWGVRYHRGLR